MTDEPVTSCTPMEDWEFTAGIQSRWSLDGGMKDTVDGDYMNEVILNVYNYFSLLSPTSTLQGHFSRLTP